MPPHIDPGSNFATLQGSIADIVRRQNEAQRDVAFTAAVTTFQASLTTAWAAFYASGTGAADLATLRAAINTAQATCIASLASAQAAFEAAAAAGI
jgi:hypothetical protein